MYREIHLKKEPKYQSSHEENTVKKLPVASRLDKAQIISQN